MLTVTSPYCSNLSMCERAVVILCLGTLLGLLVLSIASPRVKKRSRTLSERELIVPDVGAEVDDLSHLIKGLLGVTIS